MKRFLIRLPKTHTVAEPPSFGQMKRWTILATVLILAAVMPLILVGPRLSAVAISISLVCLVLWLSEMVLPFVPTLILWASVPIFLSPFDPRYSLGSVLGWAADPVLALFFGGFVLGAAAEKHGVDRSLARWAFARSGGSFSILLLTVVFLTALLSMWISNIAAAALMFACMHSSFGLLDPDSHVRRMLVVGVALGADLGGIATPIGTGPNAIAIAALAGRHQITFIEWMTFAVPLAAGMLVLGFVLLRWRAGHVGAEWERLFGRTASLVIEGGPDSGRFGRLGFFVVLFAAASLWLTEPLHRVPSAVVALAAAAVLFLSGLLRRSDLANVDWSTLLLIAGGITLGRLLEASGVVADTARSIPFEMLHPTVALFLICFASALLSALMSNTATAVLLIPIATALIPQPSTAILVAISASFGMPFVISTPPNAMAYGEGGLHTSDLLVPGLVIMIVGCVLVSVTGPAVLRLAGIP